MSHSFRAPALDISMPLLRQVREDIDQDRIKGSVYNHKNSDYTILERIYRGVSLGTGKVRAYRLPDDTEQAVREYYKDFLSQIKDSPKIRLKSFQDVNWVPVHSDLTRSPNGDRASINIGIRTSGELTHHYEYDSPDVFELTLKNISRCRHSHTTMFEATQAYVFDNCAPHSVDRFKRGQHRYLLAMSWNTIDYARLVEIYNDFSNRNSRT